MLSGAVLVSDLHLTDNPREAYRWKTFDHLARIFDSQMLDTLFILGDITEHKDQHSSLLVNRFVDSLVKLRKDAHLNQVFILAGNHDGADASKPFFAFLNIAPWCRVFTQPTTIEHAGQKVMMLPHARDPAKAWKEAREDFGRVHIIMMHATVEGSRGENNRELSGVPAEWFEETRAKVFAGDVHVPQKVGRVEYVGAPCPMRFGDRFTGRAILFPLGKRKDEPLPNIRRVMARIKDWRELRDKEELEGGDHLKVELTLPRAELHTWSEQRDKIIDLAGKKGWVLFGLEAVQPAAELKRGLARFGAGKKERPAKTLRRFIQSQKIDPKLAEIGEGIVEED